MVNTITVNVSSAVVAPTRQGFGKIAVPSYNAAWTGALWRDYASEAEMIVDYPTSGMYERVKMRNAKAQSPAPETLRFFRAPSKPTQVVTLSAITPATRLGYVYQVQVDGPGFSALVSYTADGTPTDAEYAAGMVTALNGVAGKNYTASGAASPVTITSNTAGALFSIEVLDPLAQRMDDLTTNPGIENDIAAAMLQSSDFYFVDAPPIGSRVFMTPLATWVESNGRMMVFSTSATDAITTTSGADDAMERAKTNGLKRTGVVYHRSPLANFGGAWMAKVAPKDPGKVNFAHKLVALAPQYALNSTWVANILAKNGNGYDRSDSGRFKTFWGTAGDGTFLDQTRSIDWLVYEIKRATALLLEDEDIVLWTRSGFNLIEGRIDQALDAGVTQGIVSPDFPRTITLPNVDLISSDVRNSRIMPPIAVSCTGAGAVNRLTINLNFL